MNFHITNISTDDPFCVTQFRGIVASFTRGKNGGSGELGAWGMGRGAYLTKTGRRENGISHTEHTIGKMYDYRDLSNSEIKKMKIDQF